MNIEEYKLLALHPKPPKYRNKKTDMDGLRFDSKKEAKRWRDLNIMYARGEITRLTRQVPYQITVKNYLICKYIADFVYTDSHGITIIEDAKSPITAKDPVYRLKKRLMLAVHNIVITEV